MGSGIDIAYLRLENFMVHKNTELEFPEAGVVVISGVNGSGKSAIVDGVHWGLFNSTLRKTSPVPPSGNHPRVVIATNEVDITREKKAGRVTWNLIDEDTDEWETNTKAQLALEQVIGDKTTWERTHYFSNESAGFASATDSNRKRLLESLLGLEHYEVAYRAARADLLTANGNVATSQCEVDEADARRTTLLARYDELCVQLEANNDSEDTELPGLSDLKEESREIEEEIRKIDDKLYAMNQRKTEVRMRLAQAKRDVEAFAVDTCPTCHQSIGDDIRSAAAAKFHKAHAKCVTVEDSVTKKLEKLKDVRRNLSEELQEVSVELGRAVQRKAAKLSSDRRVGDIETRMADIECELDSITDEMKALNKKHRKLVRRAELLSTVAGVLSPTGYRANMIASALSGVEVAANEVLGVLSGGTISVQLRAYTENASGTVNDCISLVVNGVGGGFGYAACSLGQRRRIDAAIVLALAALAGARGTLFFDEVFDGLDTDGTDRLAELLAELAIGRVVVVVTHSVDLARRIRSVNHWTVRNGVVTTGGV